MALWDQLKSKTTDMSAQLKVKASALKNADFANGSMAMCALIAAADGTISFAGWDNGYGNTVRISLPSCDKTYRMARKAGAVVTKSISGRECHFPNRGSLEVAMARYAKRPDNWIEILRVGD